MKVEAILRELEQAARQLGIRVSYEHIDGELGAGGLCRVRGQWRIIVDRRTTPGERVGMLAEALARFDLAGIELSPAAAQVVERSRGLGSSSRPGPGR
ncbi:MAG: hypothetical protein RMK29_19780 [Myxococcales bacterium]|nr:hypothetical protein [Myxococcota bacterium]MDW8283949.1 hypothetical protein [Myxococcales bacterium]